jgi:uncharacterized phage-associated protein
MDKCKYENAILFFAGRVSGLGRVKLNKLLYFADFDHFERYGQSITGDTYVNNDLGPVPSHVRDVLDSMEREGKISVCRETVVDYVRYRLQPLVEADLAAFRSSEVEMLWSVAAKWQSHTAKEVVIASHGEAPWLATRRGEEIPYPLAYYRGKFNDSDLDYDVEPREERLPVA